MYKIMVVYTGAHNELMEVLSFNAEFNAKTALNALNEVARWNKSYSITKLW